MDARSTHAPDPPPWLRTLILSAALLLLGVTAFLASAPISRASDIPPIQAVPWMVTPGMTLSITVSAEPPSQPIPFRLYATLQQVGNGQCPGAQAVWGLGVLTIEPSHKDATVTFAWPEQLGVGSWWLCAITTDNDALLSISQQPLVVVTTLPTATATFPDSTVIISGNANAVPAGATLNLEIDNWDFNQQLTSALLVADDPATPGSAPKDSLDVLPFTLAKPFALGVRVTLPQTLAPGSYHLVLTGTQTRALSTPSFTVIAAIATATPASSGSIQPPSGSGPTFIIVLVVAALLIAAAAFTVTAIRRRIA